MSSAENPKISFNGIFEPSSRSHLLIPKPLNLCIEQPLPLGLQFEMQTQDQSFNLVSLRGARYRNGVPLQRSYERVEEQKNIWNQQCLPPLLSRWIWTVHANIVEILMKHRNRSRENVISHRKSLKSNHVIEWGETIKPHTYHLKVSFIFCMISKSGPSSK